MTSTLWQMEDDLNFLANGRRPQFFWEIEDDLNFLEMEDDQICLGGNGRQPQFKSKLNTNLILE
jgi:hypothetical protein